MIFQTLFTAVSLLTAVSAHVAFWHPSMYGFNVTDKTFAPRDNRPVVPLQDLTFADWWFHGHLAYPPHPIDRFKLPAGGRAVAELACHKGATSYWKSSEGPDIRQGQSPCPNSPMAAYHTRGRNDVKGCALAIAYKSNARLISPADFTIFSVNQTCVWTRNTEFQIPADLPPCPAGGCTCAWFWIHSEDSGSEQNYMNGFRCEVTGSRNGGKKLQKSKVARRCGADPKRGVKHATPSNCTVGAKQPLYWHQKERNNMFEGEYSPPFYNDLYNFRDGAQNDIFEDHTPSPAPVLRYSSAPVSACPRASSGGSPSAKGLNPKTTAAAQPDHTRAPSPPHGIPCSSSERPAVHVHGGDKNGGTHDLAKQKPRPRVALHSARARLHKSRLG